MADEIPLDPTAQGGGMQIRIDDNDVKTHYSNTYRILSTAEEVIIDVGFNMPDPRPRPGSTQPGLLLQITDRIILNYTNTKRLAQSLTQLVKRYEQQFGEVPSPQSRQPLK